MANNEYYWAKKKEMAHNASHRTSMLESKYPKEIQDSFNNTRRYEGVLENIPGEAETDIKLVCFEGDSIEAVMKCREGTKAAVLNFASYKFAGGGYIAGSRAQEESLCHESFLYNVLSRFEDTYYVPNRKDVNRGLYRSKALYSPRILFNRNTKKKYCDVITCAAPNFSAASKNGVSREENNKIMRERIRFVLEIAKREKVETLILGAWGCGVFDQDSKFVAKCFAEEIENIMVGVKMTIVFAVIPPLPHQADNLKPFVEMVKDFNNK